MNNQQKMMANDIDGFSHYSFDKKYFVVLIP